MSTIRSKVNKVNKLMKITRAPIKILCKARDFYVKNMLDFAGGDKVGYGGVSGGATHLPRSLSVNSSRAASEKEFKALLRLLSKKGSEMEAYMQYCRQVDGRMKRSYSVGVGKIGRIDEDRACSFMEDDNYVMPTFYPRSRSRAVRIKF